MKIPGDGKEAVVTHIQNIAKRETKGITPESRQEKTVSDKVESGQIQDTVKFSLGRTLSEELNPERMQRSNSERMAELKRLIEAGEYNPGDAVAQKVADIIDEEIMFERLATPKKEIEEA